MANRARHRSSIQASSAGMKLYYKGHARRSPGKWRGDHGYSGVPWAPRGPGCRLGIPLPGARESAPHTRAVQKHHPAHLALRVESVNHGLGGARIIDHRENAVLPQEAVREAGGIIVEPHDLDSCVDLIRRCIRGAGVVKRCEISVLAAQKTVVNGGAILVRANDVALGVDSVRTRRDSSGVLDIGERAVFASEKTLILGVRCRHVHADDLPLRVDVPRVGHRHLGILEYGENAVTEQEPVVAIISDNVATGVYAMGLGLAGERTVVCSLAQQKAVRSREPVGTHHVAARIHSETVALIGVWRGELQSLPIPWLRESAHGAAQQHTDDRQNPAMSPWGEARTEAKRPAM